MRAAIEAASASSVTAATFQRSPSRRIDNASGRPSTAFSVTAAESPSRHVGLSLHPESEREERQRRRSFRRG